MVIQEVNTFCAIYSKSNQGHYLTVNEDTLKAVGGLTPADIVGLRDVDLPWAPMSECYLKHDRLVINSRQTHVFYEPCLYAGKPQLYRATKTPIIGHSGRAIGIHGVSVLVSERCLIPLTKQQISCLRLLALGNTYKQIAVELGLSAKTVEHYLDAVKIKLNCESRSDLIMQAIERGLVGVF